jgi:hypothetical protein
MALPDPDMSSCREKKRCLFGPNAGKAYDALDPCQGGGVFDPETCDCLCPCNGAGYAGYTVEIYYDNLPDPAYTYANVEEFEWIGEVIREISSDYTAFNVEWRVRQCGNEEWFELGRNCGSVDIPTCGEDDFYYTQGCPEPEESNP